MNILKNLLKVVLVVLTILIIIYIKIYLYFNFFATKISFVNNTSYLSYVAKGEHDIKYLEPTEEELNNTISVKIESQDKGVFSVLNSTLFSESPVEIYIGWHTLAKDSEGHIAFPHQSRKFYFSDEGFCEYQITINNEYIDVTGMEKNYCYKRILVDPDFKL